MKTFFLQRHYKGKSAAVPRVATFSVPAAAWKMRPKRIEVDTKKIVPLPKSLFLYQKECSSTKKSFIPKAQLTLSANLPLFLTMIPDFLTFLGSS